MFVDVRVEFRRMYWLRWFGTGGRIIEALLGYGLTDNKQISQDMYRLGRKALIEGYQLNDRGLVE